MPSIHELERLFSEKRAIHNANENRSSNVVKTAPSTENAYAKVFKFPSGENNQYATVTTAEGKTPESQQPGPKLGIVNETDLEAVSSVDPNFAFKRARRLIAEASKLEPAAKDSPGRLKPIVDAVRLISRAEPVDPEKVVSYNEKKQAALNRIKSILNAPKKEQTIFPGVAAPASGKLNTIQEAKRDRA